MNRARIEQTLRNFRTHPRGNRNFEEGTLGVERNDNMNLADGKNTEKFVAMLEKAEPHVDAVLDNWESKFVEDMRSKFETREQAIDLGMNPWNPTINQWNTLHGIASKL